MSAREETTKLAGVDSWRGRDGKESIVEMLGVDVDL
jgi:hypothetical protein